MNAAHAVTTTVLMIVSGVAGWRLKPDAAAPAAAPARHAGLSSTQACTQIPAGEPLVAVATDGNVTLRVEQRPLEWVLEEIEAQTGHPTGIKPRTAKVPAAALFDAACAEAPAPDPARLERTLESGVEQLRYDTLLQARGAGVELPEERLKTLFQYDPSPRVRLQAFDAYLMSRAHDARAVRSLLEQARYIPDAALQRRAAEQLQQLDQLDQIDAQSAQHEGS
jgi:hypothetical protein